MSLPLWSNLAVDVSSPADPSPGRARSAYARRHVRSQRSAAVAGVPRIVSRVRPLKLLRGPLGDHRRVNTAATNLWPAKKYGDRLAPIWRAHFQPRHDGATTGAPGLRRGGGAALAKIRTITRNRGLGPCGRLARSGPALRLPLPSVPQARRIGRRARVRPGAAEGFAAKKEVSVEDFLLSAARDVAPAVSSGVLNF